MRVFDLDDPEITVALARAVGRDWKGKSSLALYIAAVPLAFVSPWIAGGLYVLVAVMWLIPDRRIERTLVSMEQHKAN